MQLVLFLAAEFPVQLLIKRYGFRRVLPLMMIAWSLVSWTQAWMSGRASFYVTRALIGALEGGFIPGTILFATYFYKTRELSFRLAFFWSSLNVCSSLDPSETNADCLGCPYHFLAPRRGNPQNARNSRQAGLVLALSSRGTIDILDRSHCELLVFIHLRSTH